MPRIHRILFVGPFPWPHHQGSQTYVAGQATALARRGHEVHLAVYGTGSTRARPLPGVTVHRARPVPGGDFTASGLHPSRPLHDLLLAGRVRRLARQLRPDVVHAHNVEGPIVSLGARLAGIPVVYDLHTRMAEELPDYFPRWPRRWVHRAGAAVDRLALRASDAGCAISTRAERAFRDAGLPCVRVGPAVDPEELVARDGAARTIEARFGPGPWVVYTGNLDAYQNVPALFEAAADLPAGARLLVVTGDDRPLPRHSRVAIWRTPDFRDAIDALSVASVAVIPRIRCSGFPIKLLNQLGMGVPTVMLDTAAVDLPGVVPTTAIGPAITRLLEDDARRDALGRAARAAILADWTPDARAAQLEALYARVSRSAGRA
jgi:glycosyltransferase involved in cell wall biosynthesis